MREAAEWAQKEMKTTPYGLRPDFIWSLKEACKVTSVLRVKVTRYCGDIYRQQVGERRGSKVSCALDGGMNLMHPCGIQRQVYTRQEVKGSEAVILKVCSRRDTWNLNGKNQRLQGKRRCRNIWPNTVKQEPITC